MVSQILTLFMLVKQFKSKELALVVVAFSVTPTRAFFVLVARLADLFGE